MSVFQGSAMDIKQYLTEAEKQYHLRLKTIVPLDDELMDKIEMMVAKYQPTSISRPMKTIMQRQPLDFPNVDCAEVFIVDMSFMLPTAPHVLRADLRKVLDAPENFVFVRNQNEPGEWQTEMLNALADIEAEAKKQGLIPVAALEDPEYNDSDLQVNDLYGNDYNASLLGYLGQVEQERKDAIQRVVSAPFVWLDLPDRTQQEPVQDNSDFNANIRGAPIVAPAPRDKPSVNTSIFGNLDPSAREVRRVYKDANGNKVVLARKLSDGEI
jgi:hypothetical protein